MLWMCTIDVFICAAMRVGLLIDIIAKARRCVQFVPVLVCVCVDDVCMERVGFRMGDVCGGRVCMYGGVGEQQRLVAALQSSDFQLAHTFALDKNFTAKFTHMYGNVEAFLQTTIDPLAEVAHTEPRAPGVY
eukprot:GDKI01033099.1.p1 GENE.GDKI01033099.1~~GDKI01033099.1.p1  ORF type:complete len:132 (+),score=42.80 GDKI01033099.1:66-461(+)